MTKWKVLALIAAATLLPALTVAVVLSDLPAQSRQDLMTALGDQVVVLALGLIALVAVIGGIAWRTWRTEQRRDRATAAAITVIADTNSLHRLPGATATEAAVNRLAERHHSAEDRLATALAEAHDELRLERDRLLAVLAGLDVPVTVVDDAGRVLLANPAARAQLPSKSRLAAGRSIFGTFDAEDLMPVLSAALTGERPTAVIAGRRMRVVRITGPEEPVMILLVGEAGPLPPADAGPVVGLSFDLARPSRRAPNRAEWLATPLSEIVFTVLDCETTGLFVDAGDRLIALGAVRVDGAVVRADDTFEALVDPGRHIPESSTEFHGITDEHVVGAPSGAAVLADFAAFTGESVLVGHHLSFDRGFLAVPAEAAGVELEQLGLDTMLLSAVLDTDPDTRHGLDAVCERFGVAVLGRHTALGDALATAEVLVRMIPRLAERDIVTLSDARRAMAATDLAARVAGANG